jgi:hypothetical protein
MDVYIHTYIDTYMHTYNIDAQCERVPLCDFQSVEIIYVYMYLYTHICIYIYIHTYIHTYAFM